MLKNTKETTISLKKKTHHIMYMDNIKIFAENEKEIVTLIQTTGI